MSVLTAVIASRFHLSASLGRTIGDESVMKVREDLKGLLRVEVTFGEGFKKVKLCRKVLKLRMVADGTFAPRAMDTAVHDTGRKDNTPMRSILG